MGGLFWPTLVTPPSLPLLTPFSSSVHKYLLRACEALCQAGGEGDSAASGNGPSPAPMKLAFQRREGQGSNNHPVTMISCCTKGQVWGCADGPPPPFPADQRGAVPSLEAGRSRQAAHRQAALGTERGAGPGLHSANHSWCVGSLHLRCCECSWTAFVSMTVSTWVCVPGVGLLGHVGPYVQLSEELPHCGRS